MVNVPSKGRIKKMRKEFTGVETARHLNDAGFTNITGGKITGSWLSWYLSYDKKADKTKARSAHRVPVKNTKTGKQLVAVKAIMGLSGITSDDKLAMIELVLD